MTQEALDWALELEGLADRSALRKRLLDLYWCLEAYPEVPETLRQLRDSGLPMAILSTVPRICWPRRWRLQAWARCSMHRSVSTGSAFLNRIDGSTQWWVSISMSRLMRWSLLRRMAGMRPPALGYGFEAVWTNRDGAPMERLPWKPKHVITNLAELPAVLQTLEGKA